MLVQEKIEKNKKRKNSGGKFCFVDCFTPITFVQKLNFKRFLSCNDWQIDPPWLRLLLINFKITIVYHLAIIYHANKRQPTWKLVSKICGKRFFWQQNTVFLSIFLPTAKKNTHFFEHDTTKIGKSAHNFFDEVLSLACSRTCVLKNTHKKRQSSQNNIFGKYHGFLSEGWHLARTLGEMHTRCPPCHQ